MGVDSQPHIPQTAISGAGVWWKGSLRVLAAVSVTHLPCLWTIRCILETSSRLEIFNDIHRINQNDLTKYLEKETEIV